MKKRLKGFFQRLARWLNVREMRQHKVKAGVYIIIRLILVSLLTAGILNGKWENVMTLSLIHIYMGAGPASYGLTDSMGRMHGDAQFAGSSSVPAHVEMMGLIGMGNNPMVGATVACAVAVYEAVNK